MGRMDAALIALITRLGLAPHPEGGHYRRIYASAQQWEGRPALTAIQYVLTRGECSRWHRVDADECWHWQQGGALELRLFDPRSGSLQVRRLGACAEGDEPMVIVPTGWWQAARPLEDYTLVGCTVSPGFVWEGFAILRDDEPVARRLREIGQWP